MFVKSAEIIIFPDFRLPANFDIVGRGDSHSPFWGEKPENKKNVISYHQKGQVFISKWPRFQPHTSERIIFPKIKKKVATIFYPSWNLVAAEVLFMFNLS